MSDFHILMIILLILKHKLCHVAAGSCTVKSFLNIEKLVLMFLLHHFTQMSFHEVT